MFVQACAHFREREAALVLPPLLLSLALAFAASSASMAEPLRGSVTAEATGGYGRLVFVLSEDAQASARSPVAISVDRPQVQAPDYIGEVRHDPDGRPSGSRWRARSLSNSTGAAEKLFVDLLPDTDARAFDVVSAPLGTSGPEFRDIARLDGFLHDMQARYPDAGAASPGASSSPSGPGEGGSGFVDRAGDKSGGADAGAAGLRRWNEGATLKLFCLSP